MVEDVTGSELRSFRRIQVQLGASSLSTGSRTRLDNQVEQTDGKNGHQFMTNYVVANELTAYDKTRDTNKSWLLVNNKVPR